MIKIKLNLVSYTELLFIIKMYVFDYFFFSVREKIMKFEDIFYITYEILKVFTSKYSL